jgi:outer membrane receptor protein involved in Fe transport
MKLRHLFITLFITTMAFAQKGTISGTITDKESNNAPLAFANAMIKGTNIGTTSDETGKYTFMVAAGNYTLVFSFLGYENIEVPVTVVAGETVTVNKALGSGNYTLQDVVVKASGGREKQTALLMEQKKAVEIKQSIGAQEMSRKGVSDVEEGLTKITGITKVGSRGLFVRGLEDRYNNLLINGLASPTNDPFKKIIPLDIFPTDIVSVIEVYKTFNPNISGDFAGGTFNIVTSLSGKSTTKLSIGVGYRVNSSLKDFSISENGDNTAGFFGLNGKDRELPSVFGKKPTNRELGAAQSNSAFKDGWNVNQSKSPLNSSIGFLHSEKFDLNKNRQFSYILSLNFDNDYQIKRGVNRTIDLNGVYDNDLYAVDNSYTTATSSLLGLNYKSDRLNLSFNTMFLHSTEATILDQKGYLNGNIGSTNLYRTNEFTSSDYLNGQLFGEYALTESKNHTIKAGASYAVTNYQMPDRKFYNGNVQADGSLVTNYNGNNFIRQFLDIDGESFYSGLLEYNWKFGKSSEKANKLTLGYNGNATKANTSYRFVYLRELQIAPSFTLDTENPDDRLASDITSGRAAYIEGSNASYKTKLEEFTNSGYANLLLKFNKLEINGGLRAESYSREIKYKYNGKFTDPLKKKTIDEFYLLPSLNFKYGLNEKSNLRLALSQTYTKPIIMEVLPISIINADKTSQQGNETLKNSDNFNADLKYEIFPTSKEMIAVGVFGKKIDNPIERTYRAEAGSSQITTFLNSDQATLYGAELEFLLELERISKGLSNFSFGFNTSLMKTSVKVPQYVFDPIQQKTITSIETHRDRELQGASKWIINSDLKYQFNLNKSWENTVSLVYSIFGKRIYSVGTGGLDHIYELPVSKLDLIWTSKLSEKINLKFSADNILNPKERFETGNENVDINVLVTDRTTKNYSSGTSFSASLSYTF